MVLRCMYVLESIGLIGRKRRASSRAAIGWRCAGGRLLCNLLSAEDGLYRHKAATSIVRIHAVMDSHEEGKGRESGSFSWRSIKHEVELRKRTASGDEERPPACRVCGRVYICQGHYPPTGRPLVEPPMFDYEDFIENKLASNIRFSKLFPNDIEMWTKCRDLETEGLLLKDYHDWVKDIRDQAEDSESYAFYEGLFNELVGDQHLVNGEIRHAFNGASDLGAWEFENLDQDGGTKQIQAWSVDDWRYSFLSREAWTKYAYLAPPAFKPTRFWSRETCTYIYVTSDGSPWKAKKLIWSKGSKSTLGTQSSNTHELVVGPLRNQQATTIDEHTDNQEQQQQQHSAPSSHPPTTREEQPFNYEDYAWYSGV